MSDSHSWVPYFNVILAKGHSKLLDKIWSFSKQRKRTFKQMSFIAAFLVWIVFLFVSEKSRRSDRDYILDQMQSLEMQKLRKNEDAVKLR